MSFVFIFQGIGYNLISVGDTKTGTALPRILENSWTKSLFSNSGLLFLWTEMIPGELRLENAILILLYTAFLLLILLCNLYLKNFLSSDI